MHIDPIEILGEVGLAIAATRRLKPGDEREVGQVHITERDVHVEITFTIRRDAKLPLPTPAAGSKPASTPNSIPSSK